ncbi:MAG: geranylgeranylglycerol-phosphate geranylgeranyltransferase [Melioribacteraceae bacterium]|nr:geranylgeranylglycerol-phosphate geranylgeranyltransferase [Melioribacteraceae bacterium]
MLTLTIKILRPVNIIIIFFTSLVASIICINGDYETLKILLAALSASSAGAAGYVINDYFDIEIDKINRPKRIIASGRVNLQSAIYLYILLVVFSLILSVLINLYALIIALASTLIIFFYSYHLQKITLVGNITVSFFTGMVFIYGGLAVNNWTGGVIPAVFAFFTNFAREIIKDAEDLKGDKANKIITFPGKFGLDKTISLVNIIIATTVLLTTLPFILKIYGIEYFIFVMPFVNGLFVYIIRLLNDRHSHNIFSRASSLLKVNMVLGLIAIYLGNI